MGANKIETESSDDEFGDDDVNLAKKGRGRPKKAGTNEVEGVKARRYEKVVTPEKITQNIEQSPTRSLDEEITLDTAGSLPRKLQETAKLGLQKPCNRCKTSEATCNFLVSYQPFFDKHFQSPLHINCQKYI